MTALCCCWKSLRDVLHSGDTAEVLSSQEKLCCTAIRPILRVVSWLSRSVGQRSVQNLQLGQACRGRHGRALPKPVMPGVDSKSMTRGSKRLWLRLSVRKTLRQVSRICWPQIVRWSPSFRTVSLCHFPSAQLVFRVWYRTASCDISKPTRLHNSEHDL